MKTGWLIPDYQLNKIQQNTFAEMMRVIRHGGSIDVTARIDGKDYRWQCDGLAHAIRQEKAFHELLREPCTI